MAASAADGRDDNENIVVVDDAFSFWPFKKFLFLMINVPVDDHSSVL
jgi:hypothetical protein